MDGDTCVICDGDLYVCVGCGRGCNRCECLVPPQGDAANPTSKLCPECGTFYQNPEVR